MFIRKRLIPLFIFTAAYLLFFTIYYISKMNLEFILYIVVICIFLFVLAISDKKVNYPLEVLWGLTIWGLLHMAGGSIYIGTTRLYDTLLIPISETYRIFQYDQFVHIFGFGVATYLMFHIISPYLKKNIKSWVGLSVVVVFAGLGVGALNEIIEFFVDFLVPQSGVGDYINTSLDLVSDLIGALLAILYISYKKYK